MIKLNMFRKFYTTIWPGNGLVKSDDALKFQFLPGFWAIESWCGSGMSHVRAISAGHLLITKVTASPDQADCIIINYKSQPSWTDAGEYCWCSCDTVTIYSLWQGHTKVRSSCWWPLNTSPSPPSSPPPYHSPQSRADQSRWQLKSESLTLTTSNTTLCRNTSTTSFFAKYHKDKILVF